jgi:hypothetical protein
MTETQIFAGKEIPQDVLDFVRLHNRTKLSISMTVEEEYEFAQAIYERSIPKQEDHTKDGSEHALSDMVRKLDAEKAKGRGGYTTHTPEVIAILQGLSPLVPASVLRSGMDDLVDEVRVNIRIGFSLGRSELADS